MGEIGTGTAITFASGFLAEIIDISGPGGSRESVQMSHMLTTTAHIFSPVDLVDWGELTIELLFNPGTTPPIGSAEEIVTITFPNSAGTTWTFTGFMTGMEPAIPLEDRMTTTVTIKVDGDISIA